VRGLNAKTALASPGVSRPAIASPSNR